MTVALLGLAMTAGAGARAADQFVTATSGNEFSPPSVTINVGEKVTWTNAGGTHNVKFSETDQIPAAASSEAWTVERTFDTAGTYQYVCDFHGSSMAGTVVVVAPGSPGTPPPGPPPGPAPGPPTDPGTGDPPPELAPLKVTLKVSDATPLAGTRVRLFGDVRPARDGQKVRIQRRGRGGKFRTIATARLRDAGASKSTFSVRLEIGADAVLRARVAGDDERATGVSRTRALDVHRRRR